MRPICVFDVNETLLDLHALDDKFEKFFHDKQVKGEWFNQLIQSSFVSIITDSYSPFGEIGVAALDMVANVHNVRLTPEEKKEILSTIVNLPAHPDVVSGLKRLKSAGYTLVSLTNSTFPVVKQQLENAGIAAYFDGMFSADTVKRLKPAPEPYLMVAEHFKVAPKNLLLIAAHAWDIAGAVKVECKTAFIQRPGKVLDPLIKQPDFVGKDLGEIVDQMLHVK